MEFLTKEVTMPYWLYISNLILAAVVCKQTYSDKIIKKTKEMIKEKKEYNYWKKHIKGK